MTLFGLQLSIVLPAFIAGILVVSTHIPLGREVLQRGILFIDLAIAQVAGLGVIAAYAFGWESQTMTVQLAATTSALVGALLLSWTANRWPQQQEAIIGVVYILAATGGILLLAKDPHSGEHMNTLLNGQILWVDWPQLANLAVLYSAILFIWFYLANRLGNNGFYILFALAVTASVQLIGVYLVFATLIIPALGCLNAPHKYRTAAAYAIGIVSYATGLLLSVLFDMPTGAMIVWSLAVIGLAARIICTRTCQ